MVIKLPKPSQVALTRFVCVWCARVPLRRRPILSNVEAIAVNQHWNGSPGQLLLTDTKQFPSPVSANGYYEYPGTLGQARGWQNVPGMLG